MTKDNVMSLLMLNVLNNVDTSFGVHYHNILRSLDLFTQDKALKDLVNSQEKVELLGRAEEEIKSLLYKVGRKMQENIDGLHTDRKYINQRKVVE